MLPRLLHHLLDATPASATKPAVVDGEAELSYGALRERVERMAFWLGSRGVRQGDRVVTVLPKCAQECIALLAVSRADGIVVPVNQVLRNEQIRHIVADCGARMVLTSPERVEALRTVLSGVCTPEAVAGTEEIAVSGGNGSTPPLTPAQALGRDLAAILYTSGSTGHPKGVMLSHDNLIAGTRIVRTYLNIGADDRILSVLPFSFDYGLNQLLTAVEQGATIVLSAYRLGDEIVAALKKHRITGFAGVPAIWTTLARAAPSLDKTQLPDLRYITNSGGAVPSETVKRLRALLPTTDIYLMYGLTEAFRSTYLPPGQVDVRPTSIGKAIPECEVFAVTPEGKRAAPGEVGTLVHRGPTVSLGYWNRPDDTARVFRQNPFRTRETGGDIVCWSGDLVTQDEDGYFYFVARDDAMIKSAGFRISPTEVEEILMATGSFQQVAVIGLPDEWIGERVHAVGVPAPGHEPVSEILKNVAGRLPPHMVPKGIDLVEVLPVTANRKFDYKRLVEERI